MKNVQNIYYLRFMTLLAKDQCLGNDTQFTLYIAGWLCPAESNKVH